MEPITGAFSSVVFAGMGGSALAALLSQTWPGHRLPFEVCRQYHIPNYVSPTTLFIASSYSGNTEETLSGLAEAEAGGAQIAVIAGGGKLIEIAKEKSYPHLILPAVGMPRYGVLYSFNALMTLLKAAGFVDEEQTAELSKTSEFLAGSVADWLPTVPADKNPAKQLANELVGKSIVIYSGPLLAPAAYKWKISFNENSKNLAWWNEYPEWNHNETSGWIGQPIDKVYGVVELRSNLEHEKIQKRFELMERLLSGKRPAPNTVQAQGEGILQQLLWTVVFGDFVSLYLALLNNIDPSPVDLQEKIKIELNK
jgi:glucose/mannose-6-phosphate isomerase